MSEHARTTTGTSGSARPGPAPTSDHAERRSVAHLPFRFGRAQRPTAAAWGVRPDNARLDVDGDHVEIRFGPWRLTTETTNVVALERLAPLPHDDLVGPPLVTETDHELVLATCVDGGVRLRFERPVRCAEPIGPWAHPSLVLTLDDPALAERLLAPTR